MSSAINRSVNQSFDFTNQPIDNPSYVFEELSLKKASGVDRLGLLAVSDFSVWEI